MTARLKWPPTRGDLARLYLEERLSAAKIAPAYGLRSANPKSAETLVLYHLRKFGIERRERAAHVRKVTGEMVDEWARRYEAGESLREIAGGEASPVTVSNHLKQRGIRLMERVDAQILAVTEHERLPFCGDRFEKAYLVGLRYGDLHAVRHGRATRLRLSTAHPAMAELFESLFSAYGHVHKYSRRAKLAEYEWSLECDLDSSFEFLLDKPSIMELEALPAEEFSSFLAGFFDAEGAILLHKKRLYYNPEIAISNSDEDIIELLFGRLRRMGFSAHAIWRQQKKDRDGITGEGVAGKVIIWRFDEVQRFLGFVALRHREKTAKASLVRALICRDSDSQARVLEQWRGLKKTIGAERKQFLREAASLIAEPESLLTGRIKEKKAELIRSSKNGPEIG